MNDIEVKAALKTIKSKVEEIKKVNNEEAKRKQREEMMAKQARANEARTNNLDLDGGNNLDELRSMRSEGQKSIAESRAEERLEELKFKMEKGAKKDFDTTSRVGDNVAADD